MNINDRYFKYQRDLIYFIDNKIFKLKKLKNNNDQLSLLFIGHAFGEMENDNISIDHDLNNYLITNFNQKNNIYFFLGDFLKKGNLENWSNFYKLTDRYLGEIFYVMGNHDVSQISYLNFFFNFQSSFFLLEYGENAIFILNSTRNLYNISEEQVLFVKNKVLEKEYKNIFILSHHLVWNDKTISNNLINNGSSIENINSNNLYKKKLLPILSKLDNTKIFLISGDMGRFSSFLNKTSKNFEHYAIGYGSNSSTTKDKGGIVLKFDFENKKIKKIEKIEIN